MTLKGSDSTATRSVAGAMRALRKKRGMSCQDIVEELSRRGNRQTRSTITSQELGRVGAISIDQVVALADIFGCAITDLLAPLCATCSNEPPAGFTCGTCGRSS